MGNPEVLVGLTFIFIIILSSSSDLLDFSLEKEVMR